MAIIQRYERNVSDNSFKLLEKRNCDVDTPSVKWTNKYPAPEDWIDSNLLIFF